MSFSCTRNAVSKACDVVAFFDFVEQWFDSIGEYVSIGRAFSVYLIKIECMLRFSLISMSTSYSLRPVGSMSDMLVGSLSLMADSVLSGFGCVLSLWLNGRMRMYTLNEVCCFI